MTKFFNIVYYFKDEWHYTIFEIKPNPENLIQIKLGITEKVDGTLTKIYNSNPVQTFDDCSAVTVWSERCRGCTGACDHCSICYMPTTVLVCGMNPSYLYIDSGPSAGGGGGGGANEGHTNSNPTSNPPSNDENEIATSPIIVGAFIDAPKNPCTLLNKLTFDNNFIGRMKNLAFASNNYAFELGQMIYNDTNPTSTNNYSYVPFQGKADAPVASYTGNTTMQGVVHSHYVGASLSIFSVSDLADYYEKMKIAAITDDFFLGVVCPQGNAYIMQVNDRAAFIAFGDKHLSTEDKRNRFDRDFCQKKYNIKMDNLSSDNENGFAKMLKEMNIGTNIAKSTFIPSPTITSNTTVFKNWTKLNYNETTQIVEPQTCN